MEKKAKITKLNNFPNPLDSEEYLSFLGKIEEMSELERKIAKKRKDLDEILDIFLNKIPPMRKEIEELAYKYLFLSIEKLKNIKLSVDDYEELNPFAYFCCQYAFRFRNPTNEEIELIEKYTSYDMKQDIEHDSEEIRSMVKLFNEKTGINIDPDIIDPALIRSGNYDVIFNSVKDTQYDFDPVSEPYKFALTVINRGMIKSKKDRQNLKIASENMLVTLIEILNYGIISLENTNIDINKMQIELENEIKNDNYLAVFFVFIDILRDYPELLRQIPDDIISFLGDIQYFRNATLTDYYKGLRFENKYFVINGILDKNKTKSMQKLEHLIQMHENLLHNFKKDNSDIIRTKSKKVTVDYLIASWEYMDDYLDEWFL